MMCNKGVECIKQSEAEVVYSMDSPTATMTPGSHRSSNDENQRVKFLCSFGGSILPRPQDGKLRYVGGETRIVSAPRDISYEDLMGKMRELFEGAMVLKYQQPDEDLDALVSVVNDDDVTNMMEEYDKLVFGSGFTRLRIFLFSGLDQDGSVHFVNGDEMDNERRYVDALNSLNDSPDMRRLHYSESQVFGSLDDYQLNEQYLNQISHEGSLHNHRNNEMPIPPLNLRRLNIPQMGSGHQSITQRYNDMEAPWSPGYYSPGNQDPRPIMEVPASPSSSRYFMPYGEFPDRTFDRMPEEYNRQPQNRQPSTHQPQLQENVVWLPPGSVAGDSPGFPGNILQGPGNVHQGFGMFEGNKCEQCRTTFLRNQAHYDSHLKHGEQHMEMPNMVNGFQQVPCAECPPTRDTLMLNTEAKLHSPFYPREQNDPRPLCTDSNERARISLHQPNLRVDEQRLPTSGTARLSDHYIVDGSGMKFSAGHGNFPESHHVSSHYAHPEDHSWYMRPGHELGNEVFPDQTGVTGSSHIHIPLDDHGVRYGNPPVVYGMEKFYQQPHGHVPEHSIWRNHNAPLHYPPKYEVGTVPQQPDGIPGFYRGTYDSSPNFQVGLGNQNPLADPSLTVGGIDGSAVLEYPQDHSFNSIAIQNTLNNHVTSDMINSTRLPNTEPCADLASTLIDGRLVSQIVSTSDSKLDLEKEGKCSNGVLKETNGTENFEDSNMPFVSGLQLKDKPDAIASRGAVNLNRLGPVHKGNGPEKPKGHETHSNFQTEQPPVDQLNFVPELIASVKRVAIQSAEDVKLKVQEGALSADLNDVMAKEACHNEKEAAVKEEIHNKSEAVAKEEIQNESEAVDLNGNLDLGSSGDNVDDTKIEPTKAEAEAFARGLQTIRNDDLEEIRELGSGTYGSVYHGKWKGSDVAIKRIKASCFAGRPSERERLIADFWKEALILGSLHHPNVVSFYGIVRDGPDGSLATVTEFMVNGSLKQFLQKKDRTIDRRKRLIIAMDAAFGMEYLHEKNIVHFDLKCENLLVNMRDPHRPVCKIGDLGLSKVKQRTLVSGGVRGTLPWMAPELLSGKSNMVTDKIDVYSFGIVMWELLTGEEPYADIHCASIIGGIVNDSLRPQIPTWCDPEWKALMESCWSSDPAQRPSFAEVAQKLRNMAAAINVK
ncbi:hypothetical protein ACET3Z_024004 [Daucus carota]